MTGDHPHDHDHVEHPADAPPAFHTPHDHGDHPQHDDAHDHDHEPDGGSHDHDHDTHDDHAHDHGSGVFGWLQEAIPFFHGHSHSEQNVDLAMETNDRGIWAVKMSLIGLGATALFQVIIAIYSGSVGLLADTIHNFADALTALPLWLAFTLARRPPSRRYTYGYGRAEDVAGVVIVGMIFLSSLVAAYESYQKLIHGQPLIHPWWVGVAAIVGFLGNEGVAIFRIRVGREIGSAALIADGEHARVDGLTSLAVVFGVIGTVLGFPLADPIIGLLITIAILFIVKDTAVTMWHRLMDAIDPEVVDEIERVASQVSGVQRVGATRIRWLGHNQQAELHVVVDEDLTTRQSHDIVESVRHDLFHALPKLTVLNVHADPCGHGGIDPHEETAHHTGAMVQGAPSRSG